MEGFLVCDSDEASDPKYYGYANMYGNWIIMKSTTAGVYRYEYGNDGYAAAWAARAAGTYTLPDVAFVTLMP